MVDQTPFPAMETQTRTMRIDFNLAAANLDEAKYNYNKTIGRGGLERVS